MIAVYALVAGLVGVVYGIYKHGSVASFKASVLTEVLKVEATASADAIALAAKIKSLL
jgi:hypothetical protein